MWWTSSPTWERAFDVVSVGAGRVCNAGRIVAYYR